MALPKEKDKKNACTLRSEKAKTKKKQKGNSVNFIYNVYEMYMIEWNLNLCCVGGKNKHQDSSTVKYSAQAFNSNVTSTHTIFLAKSLVLYGKSFTFLCGEKGCLIRRVIWTKFFQMRIIKYLFNFPPVVF